MRTKFGIFTVIMLFMLVITPAYAGVDTLSLKKPFYINDESITFVGTEDDDDREMVSVVIRNPSGSFVTLLGDPVSEADGTFETTPKNVNEIFTISGVYNATAFTSSQIETEGLTLKLEYDGSKVTLLPNFILSLKSIVDKTVEEENTLSFGVSVNDPSLTELTYSLDKNVPAGATINTNTGQFIWTPTATQGHAQGLKYIFDIVVTKGTQEDRESITITVLDVEETVAPKQAPSKQAPPEPMSESELNELGIAPFVDSTKDPQTYVDRYNNQSSYKKWFDDNYSEYSSIYEAVGLEEPLLIPAPFVDSTKDPQTYVDRYNNQSSYKKWFDDNYSEYSSIYEAVGLEEPTVKERQFGICGPGTKLIDRVCTIIEIPKAKPWWQFW